MAAQIDQLSLAVGPALPAAWRGRSGAAVDFAGQVAMSSVRATLALGEAVSSNLADSKWLVPTGERDPLRFSWVFATPRHALLDDPDCPTLLKSAGLACAQANTVSDALATAPFGRRPQGRTGLVEAVELRGGDLLAAALRDAERRAMPTPPRPSAVNRPLTR
ncbi:hypothetical protein [Quadrisphaera sp. INWT6]|uniref:hypothetical protein n=1 Tax=Quadrisphaera sp. INWT6 TaxID=2596917 RepID=UPI0018924C4C|nr:hypothetical protein [Quadrisphaera sp. INWT6]MBF5082382.1 hypothetical protein [Quadrisphaera sp. INWT6]